MREPWGAPGVMGQARAVLRARDYVPRHQVRRHRGIPRTAGQDAARAPR